MASPTYSNMNESQKFERCFLALGIIGFTLLWPVMIYDGTIWALLQVAWTGVYRDGRPLLRTYTWVPPFDFMIRVLVAFFDDTINGIDNAGWYLMLDLVTTIGVAIIWVLFDAVRIDQKQKLLRMYINFYLGCGFQANDLRYQTFHLAAAVEYVWHGCCSACLSLPAHETCQVREIESDHLHASATAPHYRNDLGGGHSAFYHVLRVQF
jgi:hypothetical protein